MEINSNSRNKPTADWISNKNAIASNNISFVSNVVRCFQWLWWLLKNTLPSWACLFFLKTFCSLFLLFFFSPHCLPSAGWLVTWRSTNHICGIPLDERSVAEGPKRRIWSTIFHCILGKKRKRKKKKSHTLLFLHYSCIRPVCISCLWILLCNAASSQCSPRCYSDSEKKKISGTDVQYFGWTCRWWLCRRGGSDSVQCYEA